MTARDNPVIRSIETAFRKLRHGNLRRCLRQSKRREPHRQARPGHGFAPCRLFGSKARRSKGCLRLIRFQLCCIAQGHAPLHCSAHGKALLAFAPPGLVEEVLSSPLERFTCATGTDPEALARELEKIRQDGYALDAGGYIEQLIGVAAPVRDHAGAVVASVGIVAPSQRVEADRLESLVSLVLETAGGISRAIGWTGH